MLVVHVAVCLEEIKSLLYHSSMSNLNLEKQQEASLILDGNGI
jgi:hypothetical protein